MFPCLRKTLSSHHWQCTSLRNFLADSSACVGPRKTLTTTRTKCSSATASRTSMPLLQRAAALQHTKRRPGSDWTFIQPQCYIRMHWSTWPRWLWPCVLPALCSTQCVRCGSHSAAGWHWGTWNTTSRCLWMSPRWFPSSGCSWRQHPGNLRPSRTDPSDWKIQHNNWPKTLANPGSRQDIREHV